MIFPASASVHATFLFTRLESSELPTSASEGGTIKGASRKKGTKLRYLEQTMNFLLFNQNSAPGEPSELLLR